ncbi:MAG: hypothetical protein QW705_01880 [Zestosphaera sp.]
MPTRTLNLVRSIDSPGVSGVSVDGLVGVAGPNKVLLGFLRRVAIGGVWVRSLVFYRDGGSKTWVN